MFEFIFKIPQKIVLAIMIILVLAIFMFTLFAKQLSYHGLYILVIILAGLKFPRKKAFIVVPVCVFAHMIIDYGQIKEIQYLITRFILVSLVFSLIFLAINELKKFVDVLNYKNNQIMEINKDIVFAFVQAIDAKDSYLSNHSRNVSIYAREIAQKLGLSKEQVNTIYWSGVLHDIGKIGVSENILNKDIPLELIEWEEIKKHPQTGASILRQIPSFEKVIPNVLYHHQYYDGSGYPGYLKGEDIPIGARILAVADAFDAMTSDRVYRKGMSIENAREELLKNAGKQFDPEIVTIFVNGLDELISPLLVSEQTTIGSAI